MPPREKPCVGDKQFSTKKELKDYTRKLIERKGECVIEKYDDDFNFFYHLFLRKPYNSKYKNNIKSFKICPNPIKINEINHMFFVTNDNMTDTFSWNNCCDAKDDEHFSEKLKEACRFSIIEQREKCWYHSEKCYDCKKNKIYREFEVDHYSTNFCDIFKEFMQIYKGKLPTSFDNHQTTRQHIFKPEDKEFEKSFQEYHQEKADLQLLCKPCHRKKTNEFISKK